MKSPLKAYEPIRSTARRNYFCKGPCDIPSLITEIESSQIKWSGGIYSLRAPVVGWVSIGWILTKHYIIMHTLQLLNIKSHYIFDIIYCVLKGKCFFSNHSHTNFTQALFEFLNHLQEVGSTVTEYKDCKVTPI